jgi:hypothetical protein
MDSPSDGPLSQLLALDTESANEWREDDLASIFAHQMNAPLSVDLGVSGGCDGASPEPLKSFGDLIHHHDPPLDLLECSKQFGKAHGTNRETWLPREIGLAIYYLSIAAAWLRHGARISSLEEAVVREGLTWMIQQPWIDEAGRRLLQDALASAIGAVSADDG